MTKNRDDITPLIARSAMALPSRDRVGQRAQDHYTQAANAIRSAPRADGITRRITLPPAHAGRLVDPTKQ